MIRYGVLFVSLFALFFNGYAQDTTWVNTLNFDDITKRRGTYQFPEGKTYRKINMHYTLKCDPQTTRDNYNCGEWDYLSYIIVHDSTGLTDSTEKEHANFLIGDESPDAFDYVLTPVSDTFYRYNKYRVVDQIVSADSSTIGTGSILSQKPLSANRMQYLFSVTELTTAGFKPGPVTSIALFAGSPSNLGQVSIRLLPTGLPTLSGMEDGLFTTVYSGQLSLTAGKNKIPCRDTFNWDGTSNLIVEFVRFSNASATPELQSDNLPGAGVQDQGGDMYYEVSDNGFIEIESAGQVMKDIDSTVSVSLWCKGGSDLPKNTSAFEGVDSNGKRLVHSHLPWSNGQVYWDAGDATGYDRINKAANDNNLKDNWNHWVFTKNAKTGKMNIYLNGQLWHSGDSKFKAIPEIDVFRIGKGSVNYQYSGKIDRLSIWKSELSASEVSDLYTTDISSSQPNFSDLVCSFSFDNYVAGSGKIASDFNPSIEARFKGKVMVKPYIEDAFFNATQTDVRPKIEFGSAIQTSHLDSSLASSIVERPMVVIESFDDTNNPTKTTGYTNGFEAGYAFSFNPDGSKKDSSAISGSKNITLVKTPYWEYFERIDNIEIGRYITPYGIGLDLGPDGFKWIYDVTDYAGLLDGQVTLSAGNQQELIDLRFELIEGTPPRDLKQIGYYINRSQKSYKSIAEDINFQEATLDIHPEAKTFKLVTRITGHGHNTSSDNQPHCCEWADKTHYMKIDGKDALQWDIWQNDKCALNPVFDQGGNWAPPRAGWCPGAPVDDYNFDVTSYITGSEVSLDYEIEPVPVDNPGQGGGNYVVSMHLMQYGDYHFNNDATVEDILSPNNWEFHSRLNPTCLEPKIKVRNTGKNTITELGLKYGVKGGNVITYYWKDTLKSNEAAIIDLPFAVWSYKSADPNKTFFAEVFSVNNVPDEYADNNRAESEFEIPKVAPKTFTVYFRNNNIEDATLQIFDQGGNVVYEQLSAQAGVLTKKEITLDRGCYKLVCETENQFGLYYPLIPQVGSGLLRLIGGGFSESFNPDFGKSIEYHFTVGHTLDVEKPELSKQWTLYPNPSNGLVTLQTETNVAGEEYMARALNVSGQEVFNQSGTLDAGLLQLDMKHLTEGIYLVELIQNNQRSVFRVAIQ